MKAETSLFLIKLIHSVVWAFFVGCIVAIPIAAYHGLFLLSAILIGFVLFEVFVLAINHWSCPLTGVAARFTTSTEPNFDIFLPALVAKYNRQIFGTLYVAAVCYTLFKWLGNGVAA